MATFCRKRFNIKNFSHYAYKVRRLVLYGAENKELTFPHRKLTNFFL